MTYPAPLPHIGLNLQPGAPIIVQSTSVNAAGNQTITLSGVGAGNMLVLFAGQNGANPAHNITAASDSQGAYTQAAAVAPTTSLGGGYCYYRANTSSGTHTVTVTAANSGTWGTLSLLEISGASLSAPLDVAGGVNRAGGSFSSGTDGLVGTAFTTAVANELILGYTAPNSTNDTVTAGTGYTLGIDFNGTVSNHVYTESKQAATAGSSQTVKFSSNANTDDRTVLWIAIQPKGSAPSLQAAQGSYSVSGQVASLLFARKVPAAQGAYSVSGKAAAVFYGANNRSWNAAPLPHIGQLLTRANILAAAQGSYAVTGQAVTSHSVYVLAADAGNYQIAGEMAVCDFQTTSAQGSYAVAGQTAALTYGRRIPAVQGVYTLAGQLAGLGKGHPPLSAAQGVYSIAGQVAKVPIGRRLVAAQGIFALSGQVAVVRRSLRAAAAQGLYAVSGNAAVLFPSTATSFVLTAQEGVYNVTGNAAGVYAQRRLSPAAQGLYAVSGQAAAFARSRLLAANFGALSIAGTSAGLRYSKPLAAGAGTYDFAGNAATLLTAHPRLAAGPGSYSISGHPTNSTVGSSVDVSESRTVYVAPESRRVYVPLLAAA